jgi:GxxExxY protein
MLLPTGPGEARTLPRGPIERYDPLVGDWLSDNRHVLFIAREKGHDLRVYVRDTYGGQPRAITPERPFASTPPGLAVSPDGTSIVFTTGNEEKFFAFPVDGGEPRVVAGLLESAYEECLARELPRRGISFDRQKPLPIVYKGTKLDCGYRVDLLAHNSVILELKSVDSLAPIQEAIVLTYLRMSGCEIGWLINFNVPVLRNGIKRLVWNYRAPEDENPSPQRRGARRAH